MNFNTNNLHPADQIVMIMDRLYSYGMTTTSGGNLSIRDSDGAVWISPSGVDKGNLKREDIVKIYPNGEFEGIHKPSIEYPIHLSIYETRRDIKAVLHAHPPSLVSFSIVRRKPSTALIPQAPALCGKISMVEYDVPGSENLAKNIAECFEDGSDMVMLENHGVIVGASTLLSAFMSFEMLDFCAQIEINAHSVSNNIKFLNEKNMTLYRLKSESMMREYIHSIPSGEELDVRNEMCTLIKRAYDNRLFTSGQGSFSKKLSDGSFIITPYKMDRKYLEPNDLVRIDIKSFRKESGKNPSRAVQLHKDIYENVPEFESVVIAQPPNIMAFAVTDAEFDARLIPESYVMLKTVKKFPFGSSFMQPEMTSREFSLKNPVCIIENDCVIIGGTSLLNAYDRLEVMEYSAKAVIDAHRIGFPIFKITDEEVKLIEKVFNLT